MAAATVLTLVLACSEAAETAMAWRLACSAVADIAAAAPSISVAAAETVSTTPLTPAVRDSLKGLATAAMVDRGAFAGNGIEARALLLGAGKALLDNSPALAVEMSRVGYAQQVIETARTEGSAASATLQTARNQMREADPFATSAAISEAETKLQSLYSVIGRLSQLKLADYI